MRAVDGKQEVKLEWPNSVIDEVTGVKFQHVARPSDEGECCSDGFVSIQYRAITQKLSAVWLRNGSVRIRKITACFNQQRRSFKSVVCRLVEKMKNPKWPRVYQI